MWTRNERNSSPAGLLRLPEQMNKKADAAKRAMTISSLEDIIKAQRESEERFGRHNAVFRGQSSSKWGLVPAVFRDPNIGREYDLGKTFMHEAPSRYEQCPGFEDHSSWLVMMQHYGLPTRLLDWTRSILTAAFFSLWGTKAAGTADKSGAIWALDMAGLNEYSLGARGRASLWDFSQQPSESRQYKIFHDAFSVEKQFDETAFICVFAPELDRRIQVQQGLFTIHNTAEPLDAQQSGGPLCIKFEVLAQAKESLFGELDAIGINERILFPDLDHLAADIKRGNRLS